MSTEKVQAIVRRIVDLISVGEYDSVLKLCSISRISEKDISRVMQNYGRTFVRPPSNFDEYLDLIAIEGSFPPAWSIRAPLWTVEEGRSDLTLELTIANAPEGMVIELDDLRVP